MYQPRKIEPVNEYLAEQLRILGKDTEVWPKPYHLRCPLCRATAGRQAQYSDLSSMPWPKAARK